MSEMLIFSEKEIFLGLLPQGVRLVRLDSANQAEIEVAVCSRVTAFKLANMELPRLKLVQLISTGYDGVPLEEFSKKRIQVANAPGVYGVPIAETVLFGILQMAKKYRSNPNNRRVRYTRGYSHICELAEKTVLVMGVGNIGTEVARRLAGFQMRILGYDIAVSVKEGFDQMLNSRDDLKTALSTCDYVVCTLPDTPETKGFVNRELLACMKKSCVFLNVGRRAAINERELFQTLKKKSIGGAILDIFEWFPNPITNPFRRLNNVVVLPGVAAISRESEIRLKHLIAKNIVNIFNKMPPEHVLNRQADL